MMGWYDYGAGWGGWLVMSLMMVAFWALVILAVLMIFRGTAGTTSSPQPRGPAQEGDPMRILDERFARGEIDAEEYHSRQGALRSGTGGTSPIR